MPLSVDGRTSQIRRGLQNGLYVLVYNKFFHVLRKPSAHFAVAALARVVSAAEPAERSPRNLALPLLFVPRHAGVYPALRILHHIDAVDRLAE